MRYSFDTEIAARYGVEEAILLDHIRFWCEKNQSNPDCRKEGRCWMYASAARLAEHFSFWSVPKIRRLLKALCGRGRFWRAASAVSPLIAPCGMQSANPLLPCFRIVTYKKRIWNIQMPNPKEL